MNSQSQGPELECAVNALLSYQGYLNQLTLALLTATGVLLFTNRKAKNYRALVAIVPGGVLAIISCYLGLQFSAKLTNDILKVTILDSWLNVLASLQMGLNICSAITLALGSYLSE